MPSPDATSNLMTTFSSAEVIAACVAAIAALATLAYKNVYKKWVESRSVNNAIQAEIKRMFGVLSSHERWWAERIRLRDTAQPLIPFSHVVYTGQVKSIGVLYRETVDDIVLFYGNVDFINALQGQREQYVAMGSLPEFDWHYHEALLNCITYFGPRFGLDEKGKAAHFAASYRSTLSGMKGAFAIHDALGSADTRQAVFLRARDVIDFVKKPEGFVDELGPAFAQFENAVQTQNIVNLEAAWTSLYSDAAIDLPLRLARGHTPTS